MNVEASCSLFFLDQLGSNLIDQKNTEQQAYPF